MLVGTVIGLNRQTPQDVRTSAAVPIEKVQCGGFGCSNNSDCLQTPIKTLCHISTGQCRPMSSKDSCPSVTARVESVKKDVGGSCITKTDCKTGLDCSPAVSYTHLDVYKRQGLLSAHLTSRLFRERIREYLFVLGAVFVITLLTVKW